MPRGPKMGVHTVLIPDALWKEASEIATKRNESVSDVLRSYLREYVNYNRHFLDEQTSKTS